MYVQTKAALGGFGESSEATNWTNTLLTIGLGATAGIVLLMTLSSMNRCPRMQADYRKAVRTDRGTADEILSLARASDCAWATRQAARR